MGLICSIKYFNKAKFDGSEKKIILKNPVNTILLNPGIILFIISMSYTIYTSIG